MMKRTFRHLSRRLRIASFVPLAWWTWKYRSDLRRAVPFLKAVPKRIKAGETADVLTEAKVLRALAVDQRTRGNPDISLRGVHDGVARLRLTGKNTDAAAVVRAVPGVTDVAFEAPTGLTGLSEGGPHTNDRLPDPIFA